MSTTSDTPTPSHSLEGWTGNKCEPCKGHGVRMQDGEERHCPDCAGTGDEYSQKIPHLAPEEEISPYEQVLRDAVEPFLDWLEQREEGAHIKEVREGLIGVEDVIPDDHVVLGAHPRAQKDQGVVTIGHFRRLQAAYDGKAAPSPSQRLEGWTEVTPDMPFEVLRSITVDNQVLAFERGRYFNAWLTFDEYEGGWCWVDDNDSEPSPSHCRPLHEVALATAAEGQP